MNFIRRHFNRENPNMPMITGLLLALSIVTVVTATGFGSYRVDADVTAAILGSKLLGLLGIDAGITPDWKPLEEGIVWGLRFPRTLLGFVVGASLAVCGVTMQALVKNPLADPFLLGVSSGAAAFATFGIIFGFFSFLGAYALSLSAFLGAALTITLVYILSRVKGRINITHLLLAGVALAMITDGFTSIIKISAPNALGIHHAEFWMAGSLAGAKWAFLSLPTAVLLLTTGWLMLNYRALNLLVLGDESARVLGLNVERFQKWLVLVASLIAGVTIAVSGTIGFVGLMVPHFTRILVGGDHRRVLPISALLGGILVVWVDVAARTMAAPEEIPVGILTAVIGGPIFIFLMKRSKRFQHDRS